MAQTDDAVEAVIVTSDKAGLLERQPSSTTFGLAIPLIETPRSASFVSDLTMERYGIETINDLAAVSPGTYTATFYGVPGTLNIRGTLAENYFRGFKRIENRGTYSTPIGDAAQIEIVRGPPSPSYGAGKVGGQMNFIPKTGKVDSTYLTEPTGVISLTGGSYSKKNATVEGGLPVSFGQVIGSVYAYGEVEDSKSYYYGLHPKRQTVELSSDLDLGSGWNLAFGGMYYHSTGDIQSIGWNRVTQALIDSGTYITGRDTTLVDLDGNGYLTPNETGGSLSKSYSGTTPVTDARFTLDTGVGTTKLSPRNIFISSYDFSTTHTSTAYLDIGKTLSDTSSVKLQFFYDELSNDRFVSYGFPASYRSEVYESRLSYNFELSALDNFLVAKSVVGASYRHFQGVQKESYYSGRSAANRRDLSVGPTPTDIFDSPFSIEPGGISLTWETDLHGKWDDLGAYALTNLSFGEKLNLLLGGRYDDYHVQSQDVGTIVYTTKNRVKDSKGNFTYSASLSYKAPLGLMPYVTYAKSDALNLEQAGNLAVSTITSGQWLGKGELTEGGVKFQLLSNTLVGSLAAYDQQRTDVVGITRAIQGARAKGVELELRYLATKNFSFTYVANSQHTKIKGPDGAYYALSPEAVGISPALGYGGAFSGQMGAYPGRAGDYDYSLTPHSVQSLYGAFTTDVESWGQGGVTVGVTHATKTSQLITNPVVFPAYTVANASAFYSKDGYTVSLNIDNLFDKLYFTPNVDSPANTSVRPSTGREFRVKLQKSF